MKEQEINEKQSLEIITSMIAQTKKRLRMGDGNILLMWGYLTVGVSILVGTLIYFTHNPSWNWLWFLIWIIGGTIAPIMAKKQKTKAGAKTYTDKLCDGIWSLVGLNAIACAAVCLGMLLIGGKDVWNIMFVFALLIVGIVEAVQGMIIKERSFIFGGIIGIIAGIVTMACISGGIPLYLPWYMPTFAASWVCMTIIPGHCLNHKAKNGK